MMEHNPHNMRPHPGNGPPVHGAPPPAPIDAATGLVDESVLDSIVAQYEAPVPAAAPQDTATALPTPVPAAPAAGPMQAPEGGHTPAPTENRSQQDLIELDGAFSIRFQLFDAQIRIRSGAGADPAVFKSIRRVVDDVRIPVQDFDALQQALHAHAGQWIALAALKQPLQDKVNLFVSPDAMRVYMAAASTDERGALSILDIDRAADKADIRTELGRDTIARIVRNGLFGQLALISRGLPPTPGEHGEIYYHFENSAALSPAVLESGNVDFKSLNRIPVARAGDCLASRIPPTNGVNGISVFGRPIEAEPGRDTPLRAGDNTHITDDGLRLYADCDGQIILNGNVVEVQNIHFIDGDVDYGTGNIDFNGMVAVSGFVRDGFSIRADGDIIIEGGVEGAELESRNGDISVRLGVQGAGRAEVRAAGHVRAKFITQSIVQAGGGVAVQESIMHSSVSAGGAVTALGPRGALVGGTIRAGHSVTARFIGSEAHAATRIILEKTHPESGEPVREVLSRQRGRVSQALDKAAASLKALHERSGDPDAAARLQRTAGATRALKDLHRKLSDERIRFEHDCAPGAARNVRAGQAAYPGVHITIESAHFKIMTRCNRIGFGIDESGKISAG